MPGEPRDPGLPLQAGPANGCQGAGGHAGHRHPGGDRQVQELAREAALGSKHQAGAACLHAAGQQENSGVLRSLTEPGMPQ